MNFVCWERPIHTNPDGIGQGAQDFHPTKNIFFSRDLIGYRVADVTRHRRLVL